LAGSDLILDTCALLWLAMGDPALSSAARARIDDATAVHVCAISGFEIGLKYRRGQLGLPLPPVDWLAQVVKHHRLALLPLALTDCVRAAELPPLHRDPADRLIIAAALDRRLPVVTTDGRFAEYGVEIVS
jgi:PIN domain nuclease of toxin-antitoxin system